jgi:hypothetical protein
MPQGNFFIIGAQRSGTTWLYHLLDEHPEIFMAKPVRPEPKFFLDPLAATDKVNYLSKYFADAKVYQLLGEKGTSYIESPASGERMISMFPDAKIILMLRNPVERAISNYQFTVANGLETRSLVQVFLDLLPAPSSPITSSVSPFAYLERGLYTHFLPPWHALFGPRLKVIIFEEIRSDQRALKDLYNWLNVKETFLPVRFDSKVNQSTAPVLETEKKEVVAFLKEYYASSIKELETWLGRKIPDWNDPL